MAGPTTAERGEKAEPAAPARRTPARRKRARRAVLILLIVATVLAVAGTWLVYGSSWLSAQRVTVSGTRVLTPEQVRATAAVPLRGPLASVDTGAVERRLLAALPRIDKVTVERDWPHTIGLKVTERTPSAVLKSGGKFIEVDAEGVRFATVDTSPAGVPLVELTPDQSPSLLHFGTKNLLRAAVEVSSSLPDSVRRDARVIRMRSYDSVTVELSGGRTVVWGSAEHGSEKAAVLTALMKAAKNAGRFDVSAPSAPAASGS
ncbi:FtsQ-type POTRA domain-containing protein [Streptomyces sp. H10-C2]|uniref:cell division protein FtsQ/DivIB n=1 Tax=unclassified Streptomyces TaxID=2593676 RepID=UPI0024B8E7C4|nr:MULTISPECIES: FtsQ-type POTRA domain-containing protein [unclassified Streptomyces]MDJ0341079.1 FtsQ-type POTRA domain-containing protein [Streptomyces sp. PH10-H1]MDJ0369570.1 FtsQ-type POTRA domain-containing protein [Streptomyces sp. H10-C2]